MASRIMLTSNETRRGFEDSTDYCRRLKCIEKKIRITSNLPKFRIFVPNQKKHRIGQNGVQFHTMYSTILTYKVRTPANQTVELMIRVGMIRGSHQLLSADPTLCAMQTSVASYLNFIAFAVHSKGHLAQLRRIGNQIIFYMLTPSITETCLLLKSFTR